MSTLGELLRDYPAAVDRCATPTPAEVRVEGVSARAESIRDEQIHRLVQHLFFRHETGAVRNVGFAPVDASTQTAPLCLQVATVLSEGGKYDVGLIDASSDPVPLHERLQIPMSTRDRVAWPVSRRLRLVPRQSWWQESDEPLANHNVEQLREVMTEFDFAILYCSPASWLTARIGQNCDGLVLVLTANKTRRLVAAQVKDQLQKAQIPLLGTILAERRFPVPQGLYRSL